MKEKDRVFLMDAPLAPSGLFGDTVSSVVDRYQEARTQAVAFQRFLPRRSLALGAAGWEQPPPCASSSYQEAQKQSSGPGSSKCPWEIDLPTLPPMVLQGAAVSCEHSSKSPPGNVAVLGGLLPLRSSPEQLVRPSSAGPPLQGTELAALVTPEREATESIRFSTASFLRDSSHFGGSRAGSVQRSTYLGVVWDSTSMQVHLSPARINPHSSRESKRRLVTHCEVVPETAGLAHQILEWSQGKLLSLRAVYIPGHLNMGADALSRQGPKPGEWRLHPDVVKQIWRVFGQAQVDLFATQETSHCPLWFSLTHPAPLGLDAMVQTWPRLRLYAFSAFFLERVRRDGVHLLLVAPFWSMVLGPDFPSRRLSMGDSRQEGSPLTGGGRHLPPPPGVVEAVSVASEGAQLVASGLSAEVVETILQSRTPSSRKLYALRWKLFTSWCEDRRLDPVNSPVGTVLEFLQARLSAGLTHSTLKVYVAAIAAYHAPHGGQSVGRHPLDTHFLRGALRLRPPVRSRVPPWDLAVVLEALCKPPFEPIEGISDRLLAIKTAFLLAISSLKRVGDLQALSVAPSYLDFAPGLAKAFLYPRVGYVPKIPSSTPWPVVLQAFCPPPFREPDQRRLNCMCPLRALNAYIHRAALWRRADQLFVCFGPPKRGLPATRQTLSRWIVDAICLAYESSDLPSPLGVKAHSTRSVAASKAFLAGVSMQNICNAAGRSTPLTFTRFYGLDMRATPGSSVLLP
ncbi:uncharacterized protein LOC128318105 [Pangasianodon hypophthalmus]|uniref:uncharacterized protein LOC128318105 n=1 Tax=Pangasianodon hypophthalmus TaxID=310915 RepID=UPI0023082F7B|nr:uncharacterized protein LOC128318105 [Pangasianodon hypophthalmus]